MNDQLLSHLETFDSDEEFSESPDLVVEEHVGPVLHEMMNPFDMHLLKLKNFSRRFARPASWKEFVFKFIWLLPIGIVLGDYIGLLLSLSLSLIGLLVSMVRPEPQHHYHEEMTGHEYSMHARREISFSSNTIRNRDREIRSNTKKQVQDCRKEVSRLLGIIGAPALDWIDPPNIDLDDFALGISSESVILAVKFLEAHVQFLLTVDEAYRWLQVSASLHMGLGPRSQCVERVERASIAREFRNGRRRQSIGGSLILEGVQDSSKEPQRGLCKSVLSLAMVRKQLAKTMVDQSDSILQVWHRSQEEMGVASPTISHPEPLDIPEVVDLLWIKGSRQQLAANLSDTINVYCTTDILAKLTEDDDVRSVMEASMSNARNAREYLLCNLLLGKRPTIHPLPNPNDPLLLSLMRYREQLDALSGAIWSCQQYSITTTTYTEEQQSCKEHGSAPEWWTKIQDLSEDLRAMESEIGQRFFTSSPTNGQEDDDQQQSAGSHGPEALSAQAAQQECQTFQREGEDLDSPSKKESDDRKPPTKTLVFKGQGVKQERAKDKHSATKRGGGNSAEGSQQVAASLPPRDTMSERQMIQELRNRITLMRSLEQDDDEEDGDEPEAEAAKAARLGRAPAAPLFLGASGSLLRELRQNLGGQDEEEQVVGEE